MPRSWFIDQISTLIVAPVKNRGSVRNTVPCVSIHFINCVSLFHQVTDHTMGKTSCFKNSKLFLHCPHLSPFESHFRKGTVKNLCLCLQLLLPEIPAVSGRPDWVNSRVLRHCQSQLGAQSQNGLDAFDANQSMRASVTVTDGIARSPKQGNGTWKSWSWEPKEGKTAESEVGTKVLPLPQWQIQLSVVESGSPVPCTLGLCGWLYFMLDNRGKPKSADPSSLPISRSCLLCEVLTPELQRGFLPLPHHTHVSVG